MNSLKLKHIFSIHSIFIVVILFFSIIIIWSYFTVIDEFVKADGRIIPSKQVQVIQNLEGGIIKRILVREGQEVSKNQVLVIMDQVDFLISYKKNTVKKYALELELDRLHHELNGTDFNPSSFYVEKIPEIAKSQRNLYLARVSQLNILNRRIKLIEKEIQMIKPLISEGAAAKIDLIRLQQKYLDYKNSKEEFYSKAYTALNEANSELAQIKESIKSFKDKLERTSIKSPVRGIVKQIYINTVGGIVQPGMNIMEIVPLDDSLLIEAYVKPSDVGFVHKGQKAIINVTAYDFTRYGGLDGKVVHISADTSVDKNGNSFYEVWVQAKKSYLEKHNKKYNLIPGMTVRVEMLTGKISVFDYLLSPFIKIQRRALSEG